MHLRVDKLEKTQDALMMAQRALAPTATPDQRADALAAVLAAQSLIVEAKDQAATDAEIEEARDTFAKGWGEFADAIEIDDDAGTSRADDGSGLWVQAWVWLARDPDEDEDSDLVEASDGATCSACKRPEQACSLVPCGGVLRDRAATFRADARALDDGMSPDLVRELHATADKLDAQAVDQDEAPACTRTGHHTNTGRDVCADCGAAL